MKPTRQATTREARVASEVPSFELPAEASSRAVLVFDAGWRIVAASPGVSRLLSVEPGDILGKDMSEAVRMVLKPCFKDPAAYEASFDRVRSHPDEVLEEARETAGAHSQVLHRHSAPLFDQDGNLAGRVEVYSDITRRREVEAAVRHAYEELKASQEQIVHTEKLRAIGETASGVAHDFNNTLGIILGNLQLLLRTVKDEAPLAKLRAAERAALDGMETVRRIQEFVRTRPQEPPEVLDLGALVSEVVEMMESEWRHTTRAHGRRVDVTLDLADGAFALGRPHEIREVLANVLLNAVQAMPEGGSIFVSAGRSESSGWVRIADTGVGMTEDVRRRIFEPFFTTRGVEGTGLGMSVAYGIVRRHEGSISVESEPGRGTAVTVCLPSPPE